MKITALFISIIFVFLFASCKKQEPIQEQEIVFSAVRSGGQTTGMWSEGNIGVYMLPSGKSLSEGLAFAENMKFYTNGSGYFMPSNSNHSIKLPNNGNHVDFILYHPYREKISGYKYEIDLARQPSGEAIDLMYSANAKNINGSINMIDVSFERQLAKLTLNLKFGEPLADRTDVQAMISGMNTKAAFCLDKGQLEVSNSKAEIEMNVTFNENCFKAEALILPEKAENPVNIFITVNSSEKFLWTIAAGTSFERGNNYIFDLNINNSSDGGGGVVVHPAKGFTELPEISTIENTIFVTHYLPEHDKRNIRNYSILYDTIQKVSYWVAYPLHRIYLGNSDRTNAWNYDPVVPQVFQPRLYTSIPGFDRGHQIPSADRTYSVAGNATTFYFTNMTPQNSSLNQGAWATLERNVRSWVAYCDTLYVVTGAMITTARDSDIHYAKDNNGKNMAVPKYYYKAVAQKRGDHYYTIAYKFDNESPPSSLPVSNYQLTVSELEGKTGFTFFPSLPAHAKDKIEIEYWR